MFLGKQLSWEGNKHEPLNCCACVELTKQCFAFLPGLWTLLDYKNVHCRCHSVQAGNLRTQLKWRKRNFFATCCFSSKPWIGFLLTAPQHGNVWHQSSVIPAARLLLFQIEAKVLTLTYKYLNGFGLPYSIFSFCLWPTEVPQMLCLREWWEQFLIKDAWWMA